MAMRIQEEYFKIRPMIKEGEALSGYLARVARENGTSLRSIIVKISNKDGYIDKSKFYDIDINPFRRINVELLNQLVCIEKAELLRHTWFPLISSLYSDSFKYTEESIFQLSKFLENTRRKYCPYCLHEKSEFQLIWQIKDIKYCDTHQILLRDECNFCNKPQKLIHKDIGYGLCTYCEEDMRLEGVITTQLVIPDKQKVLIKLWRSFLGIAAPLVESEFELSVEQTICLKILYISKGRPDKYSLTISRNMSGQDETFLKKFATGQKTDGRTSYIGNVIRFLIKNEISVEDFRNLKISKEYYKSIFMKKQTRIGVCLSPWCTFKNSKEMIRPINGFTKAQTTHKNFSYCEECHITYGSNRINEKWEATGGMIELINMIRPLVNMNISRNKIEKQLTEISEWRISKAIGYMFARNITSISYVRDVEKVQNMDIDNLLEKFKLLSRKVGTFPAKMMLKARQLFGWTFQEFFCYFYQRVIQNYMFEEANRKLAPSRKYQSVMESVDQYIQEGLTNNCNVTLTEFSERFGFSKSIVTVYGLNQKIVAANNKVKHVRQKERVAGVWGKAKQFIEMKHNNNESFVAEDVYNFLNKRKKWIYENCPGLSDWVNDQVSKSKSIDLELKKIKISQAIDFLRENNQRISKAAVDRIIDIGMFRLKNGTELGTYYDTLLENSY